MRVTVKIAAPALPGELQFQQITERLPSARSFWISLTLHGVAVATLAAISTDRTPTRPPATPSQFSTTVRIGQHLYYVAKVADKAKATSEQSKKQPAPVVVRREIPRTETAKVVLLQPAFLTQAPPDVVLPTTQIVTTKLRLPKFQKEFVAPGVARIAEPAATPQLLLPPRETVVSVLAPASNTPVLPLLPAPPPILAPVTKPVEEVIPPKGDLVNIVAVAKEAVPIPEKLVIPPGNVVPASVIAGALTSTPPEAVTASTAGSGTGEPGRGRGPAPPLPGAFIVRSANGKFDAVVVQTSSLDQFPAAKNVLKGRPIYTVYISLETARDWALFFCVPGQTAKPMNGDVVKLEAVVPVGAPYPTKLLRPAVKVPSYYKNLLVFGAVTPAGHVENLKMIQGASADVNAAILASIAAWEFRPASLDGVPIGVEFLLSIPVAGL